MTHGWISLLPPLLAIGLALVARQVVLSLLLGVYVGALILESWHPTCAFMRVADGLLVDAVADRGHASIILFSMTLGGMVGILSRSGAADGIVAALSRTVRGRRGGQAATAAMGTAIFFDDYANTLLVGNTMRPLTDRLRISREKLSWLVDSTAAPVATVAVISTWVGFESGLIQDAMARQGLDGSGYVFFLRSLPYNFYPFLTLAFVFMIAGSGRDFGPMARAEARCLRTGQVLRPGAQPAGGGSLDAERGEPASPWLAAVPILLVIAVTVGGLIWSGRSALVARGVAPEGLRGILDAADSLAVLMWASVGGSLAAGVLAYAARRLDLRGAVEAWLEGARAMLIAMVILVLAWSLGAVCGELGTGPWLVEQVRGVLSARLLPMITFLIASLVSFSTGTSWGTMTILIPIIFPLASALPADAGLSAATGEGILLSSVSAVLAGAVFGDHCSPISDTTIMSSMASGADHVDHVRTQMPYAATVAAAAVLFGYLPAGWGWNPWASTALGIVVLAAAVRLIGRRPAPDPALVAGDER